MAIIGMGTRQAIADQRPVGGARQIPLQIKSGTDLPSVGLDIALSVEAHAALQQRPASRDKTDELITSWFKHLSPANSEADKRATAEEDRHKRAALAAGRSWSDPGRLPDPVKEPGRKTIEAAVSIIATDEILQAMQDKDHKHDPHRPEYGSQA
jgi:hypothetical protein